MKIPVTVFTGFLGAGKTTLALGLVRALPPGYRVALLKNEFGDVAVDSQLMQLAQAGESHLQVAEMLNGCLCCVLVGQMKNALLELIATRPDRIIIETSGSAFPAPIAWQIREMASDGLVLDGIITVIDCENFAGYEDTSYTARLQAQYTDLIALNKWESVSERALDVVIDHVATLNDETPRVRVGPSCPLTPDVAFGLDSRFAQLAPVEGMERDKDHHEREVAVATLDAPAGPPVARERLDAVLGDPAAVSKLDVYRVKGLVLLADEGWHILNWAFGRVEWTPVPPAALVKSSALAQMVAGRRLLLTVLGSELGAALRALRAAVGMQP